MEWQAADLWYFGPRAAPQVNKLGLKRASLFSEDRLYTLVDLP